MRRRPPRKFLQVNPLKVVGVLLATLLVLLVVGLLVAKSSVQSWLRGEEFRSWIVNRSSAALKSEVDLSELKWEGSEIYTDHFRARGTGAAAFAGLSLEGVRARAGGIRQGAFHIPGVTVNRFHLEFSDHRVQGGAPEITEVPDERGKRPVSKLPDWIARFLPRRAEVDEVILSSVSVVVRNPDGTVPFTLSGARSSLQPDFETGMWEIQSQGGQITVPDQPAIRLNDLAMRWRETSLFIDRCALGIFGDGHVVGTGEISFEEEGNFDLELNLRSIQVGDLVEGDWKERLSGEIQGPVRVTGRPGDFTYEGSMGVSEGVVKNFPVLTLIANYTQNEQFKHLILSEAKTDFLSSGDSVSLTNITLQSDGLVRVEGDLDIVGERLEGNFRIGVAPGTLRWIPGAERTVFVEEQDGFLWAPMIVSGTKDEPKEDLSSRLVSAAGEAILRDLPEGLLNEAQKFLNPGATGEDAPDAGELIDQAKPLLDLLSPFLRRP